MNVKIKVSTLLAVALSGVMLAGCDSIVTTDEDPYADVPPVKRVLEGEVTGLGSRRSVTLAYDDDPTHRKSFLAAAPYEANVGLAVVPFSFGSLPAGTPYDIRVIENPFGKICSVVSGGAGTITAASEVPPIQVECVNSVPRYDLTVGLPADPALFKGLPGARVQLRTEEEWIDVPVNATMTSVVFEDVLLNPVGQPNPFTWTVTANTTENNTTSKCTVTNATANVTASANVATPVVGNPLTPTQSACRFKVSGNIGYSAPAQAVYSATAISGLELQLRNVKGGVVETLPIPTCTPATATATCPYEFAIASRSDVRSIYDVAVSSHPTGQYCVVANGGSAFLYVAAVTGNPSNATNLNVRCRALPATANQLKGLLRLQSSTWIPNITAPVPVTVNWTPFDLTTHNYGSSNMLAFYPNGTFLYGSHAGNANGLNPGIQVEHGFYDYNPTTKKIRFTSVTDTSPGTTFPSGWGPYPNPTPTTFNSFSSNSILSATAGISATPNPVVANGSNHPSLSNVTFGTASTNLGDVRTITGEFGSDGTSTTATVNNRLTWLLQEPPNVSGEMTGAWVSQDSRRFWSWDKRTDYGIAASVMGGAASMNDACFELSPNNGSSGFYVRRPSNDGCYPFSRPVPGTIAFQFGVTEIADFSSPAMGISLGFIGRIPGGNPIATSDPRPPSPNYYVIGPPGSFPFDGSLFTQPEVPFTSWCATEILGIRPTLNGEPAEQPFYFCRSIAP